MEEFWGKGPAKPLIPPRPPRPLYPPKQPYPPRRHHLPRRRYEDFWWILREILRKK